MSGFNEAKKKPDVWIPKNAGLAQAFTLAALAAAGIVEYYDHRMQTSEVNMLRYLPDSQACKIKMTRLHSTSCQPLQLLLTLNGDLLLLEAVEARKSWEIIKPLAAS